MQAPADARTPISILIAVSVRLYREGVETALKNQAHLCVCGTAGTLGEARAAVTKLRPDVVIVDVSQLNVCDAIRGIRADSPSCRILAFAVSDDIAAILDYAEAGADGFVTASGSASDLVEAIERTAAGELLCSPRIAAQLLRRAARHTPPAGEPSGPSLTVREQQVFSFLQQGLSNKEIARSLGIAEATVKNHVHHVLEKLQVTSRGQAAASAGLLLQASPRQSPRGGTSATPSKPDPRLDLA